MGGATGVDGIGIAVIVEIVVAAVAVLVVTDVVVVGVAVEVIGAVVRAGQVIDTHLMFQMGQNRLLTILLFRGLVMSRDVRGSTLYNFY